MLKGFRFLVFLVAIAVLGAMSPIKANAAIPAKDVVFHLFPVTPDNVTCNTDDVVFISKQLLPSTGLSVTSKGVQEDNATNPTVFSDINSIAGTTDTMVLTFSLANGTFSNNLVLVLDNGTQTVVNPDYQQLDKVQFTLDNASLGGASGFLKLDLYDKNASDNYTNPVLTITVNGSLDNKDKVSLSLTTTFNGKHVYNGCFDKTIYIVENQWSAQLCCCKDQTPDKDYLVATDNGVTVKDSEAGIVGESLYNACSSYESITVTPGCCTSITPTCGLFCNNTTTTTTTTSGVVCSMPGECYTPATCTKDGLGLKIVENRDFTTYPSYKVTSLYNTPVTFTLTGNFKNIASAAIVSSADGNPASFVEPAVLGTFTINSDATSATVTIPGSTLFVKTNGGTQVSSTTPIHFKVEIKPKSNVSLMPNKFYLSAVMEAGSDLTNPQNLSWGEIIDWVYDTENTYVFMAPYLRSDNAVSSVIRFENAATTPASISLFVNNPDGSGWTFVKHITLAAGASTAVSGADFISYASAVGVTLDGTKGFAIYGLANVPSAKLTVYGSQQYKGTTNFRPLPIDVIDGNSIYAGQ